MSGQYKEFERDVLCYLENGLSKNEHIEVEYKVANRILDAYTETGIEELQIKQNTLIEIKYSLTPDSIYYIERLKNICSEALLIDDCLIIYGIENAYSKLIKKNANDIPQYIKCVSINELKRRESTNLSILEKRIWTLYEKAQYDFSNGQNAFILGAGISKSAGLPQWDELLVKLIEKTKNPCSPRGELKKICKLCNYSSIIEGRYILNQVDNNNLQQYIQEILQSYSLTKFDTIDAIVNHVIEKNVDSILTYNYDDLIERRLDEKGKEFQYYSVYGNNRIVDKYFPIYHLHGFVPLDSKKRPILSTPKITEQQYHQLYKQQYHWSNVTLLHTLNTKTCFFIGLSMNDPNLRRLLDYYSSENYADSEDGNYRDERNRHYIFMRKEPFSRMSSKKKNMEHWKTVEDIYNKWGIDIIWLDEFDELPSLIRNLNVSSNVSI